MLSDNRRLREVMQPPISIGPDESIRAAAERMVASNLSAILVVSDGVTVGLISNSDLVRRAVAQALPPQETQVEDIMNRQPIRISDDRDVASALLVMQARGVHELLVQDFTGQVVGIFCDRGCAGTRSGGEPNA